MGQVEGRRGSKSMRRAYGAGPECGAEGGQELRFLVIALKSSRSVTNLQNADWNRRPEITRTLVERIETGEHDHFHRLPAARWEGRLSHGSPYGDNVAGVNTHVHAQRR